MFDLNTKYCIIQTTYGTIEYNYGDQDMAAINVSLFSWNHVDAHSDLDRFYLVRDNLPDENIVRALEDLRGNGRNDFPVRPMWNALISGVVFQHESAESLLRELSRNPSLLEACGFDILPRMKIPAAELKRNEKTGKIEIIYPEAGDAYYHVPSSWNFSRFLSNVIQLEEEQGLITAMIRNLRQSLMEELPDFGSHMGYDGKSIQSYSTGRENRKTGKTSDPDADWGKHETKGIDSKTGKPWTKVKSWFGYGLHLIADTHHEIPVAVHVTPASHSEHTELRTMIHEVFEETPQLAERCEDFSADRGLDSAETKALLFDQYGIKPVIDVRQLWRDEKDEPVYDPEKPITRPLFSDHADTIVFTEKGSVHCVCPATGEQRDMAFCGFEKDRNTLKYRCPAAAYGFCCKGQKDCSAMAPGQPGAFGRVVRINMKNKDRRIFTPIPHGNNTWNRIYNKRSSLERINSRIDNDFGFENHYIRGKAKMKTRVCLAAVVMMAMALGHIRANRMDQIRSLVKPIPLAA